MSGIHGVEWDAVELPSQFMENFCWEWDVLQGMTARRHRRAAPRALYDKMIAAKNFQSGMQTVRQLEFSMFDLRLHGEVGRLIGSRPDRARDGPAGRGAPRSRGDDPAAWHRFPHSFSHIFAGGYAAGYYSYKWAEVLSADAFAAFEGSRRRPRQPARPGDRRALLARDPGGGRQPPGAGFLQGLPRPRT